ncbi:MAG: hypothetical protein EOO36_08560, partial [Cytophagaceae bacterium]
MQSQPPPKGSLEELFRHHLLESEAAAVPPRPLVWDHIDNSLLLAENEKYRRRLLAHRWGMAASLLLAALAGGGWWHSQQAAAPTLASAQPQREATRRAVAGAVPSSPRATNAASQTATLASTATTADVSASAKRYAGATVPSADAASQLPTSQAIAKRSTASAGSNALRKNAELAASQPAPSQLALAKPTGRGHAATPAAGTLATAATGAGRLIAAKTPGEATDNVVVVAIASALGEEKNDVRVAPAPAACWAPRVSRPAPVAAMASVPAAGVAAWPRPVGLASASWL